MSEVRNYKSDTEIRKGYFMSKNNHSSTGICFLIMNVIIMLKLIGIIPLSWMWVFSPLWIGAIILIVIVIIELFKLSK